MDAAPSQVVYNVLFGVERKIIFTKVGSEAKKCTINSASLFDQLI